MSLIFDTFNMNNCVFKLLFRGKKKYSINDEQKENKPYMEKKVYEDVSLTKDEIREIVVLPAGMDINEWLATHSMFMLYIRMHKYRNSSCI